MRRPPIACRRAVQLLQSSPPQHVWISDDLLTGALGRLFPSSCPQQKRHGSHVPGPLEARRRAAKRRMTVSAGFYPQETSAPLFNLGALFGFRKDAQPTWRYEAPSLQTCTQPLELPAQHSPSLPILQSDPTSTEHATSTTALPFGAPYPFLQNTPQAKPLEHVSGSADSLIDVVDPKARFKDFKTKIATAGTLSSDERSRLLHQTWISCRPMANNAWVYNAMVIKHLTQRHWDHTRILSNLKFFDLPPAYTPESLDLLRRLETSRAYLPHASRVQHRVYTKMVGAATSAAPSATSLQDTELVTLIRLTLQSCSRSTKATQSIVDDLCLLADKLHVSVLRKTIRSILAGTYNAEQNMMVLIARAADGNPLYGVEEILSLLPEEQLRSLVTSVTRSLVQVVERKSRLPAETYWSRLCVWMAIIGNLDARYSRNYARIALSEVAEYVFKGTSSGIARPLMMLYALIFRMTQQPDYAKYKDSLLECTHAHARSVREQQGTLEMEEEIVQVFSHIRSASLPYEPMMNMAAHLFASYANLRSLHKFHHALNEHQLRLDDTSAIQTRIATELVSLRQQPHLQTIQQREHYAFALRTYQAITDSLNKVAGPSISSTLVSSQEEVGTLQARREFSAILDRASDYHALPQAYAGLTADIPFSQRTILIHQLAHHYSLATTRTHLATWRSIYQLYNYLETYSMPIGPLFTKAVVRAAIIRPMMERRFISGRKLIWICQLVARVEGENVAQQVELSFWRWRGDLIKHAKDVHVAAGGDHRVKPMVGRLKQLDLFG